MPATRALTMTPPGIIKVSTAPAAVAASAMLSILELNAAAPFLPSYMAPAAAMPASASELTALLPRAVKNAWQTPFIDVNSILIGIRIASYGHNMEVSTQCTNCENEDDFELDLRQVLDQMQLPDYQQQVSIGDLEIVFRP
jgi:hypothetical protein